MSQLPPLPPIPHHPQGAGSLAYLGQWARCHRCGYLLRGLPLEGRCPECGTPYTEASAMRLEPWPGAFRLLLRLGWPLLGLAIMVSGAYSLPSGAMLQVLLPAYAFLLAVPINSYFQVRAMLRRHLPEQVRTTGAIAVLRAIGTVACVIVAIFLLLPFVALAACLVLR